MMNSYELNENPDHVHADQVAEFYADPLGFVLYAFP